MFPVDYLPSIARVVKKETLYRSSDGNPVPSPRVEALLRMFVASIGGESLKLDHHKPIRVDYGVTELDEAMVELSPISAPELSVGMHVVSQGKIGLSRRGLSRTSQDLLVLSPPLPETYLTSEIGPFETPEDWFKKIGNTRRAFDITKLSPNNPVPRTTHQRLRAALIHYRLL